ncbi:hypothetical protein DZK25_00760 [Wenzhouxiangella sp. 15181]|nr:hypothetical protein DZK25_00760 [Wenzhouxiangella sp. 15181]RFP68184.1 hypothetical protein DZK26_09310 [Wenzhouxiangella sp. 15190]
MALVDEFSRRIPHIPLVQHRTGQDDSALGTARFADLEARPRRLFPTDNPAVVYVELAYRYTIPHEEATFQANLGNVRLFARIEDPLCLQGRFRTVEAVRTKEKLRAAYFRRVFTLMAAQSDGNRELGDWLQKLLLPENGASELDLLAAIQNFNHNIVTRSRPSGAGREAFREAIQGFDFARRTPSEGPVSLRLSVRPHRQDEGSYTQSITNVLVGNSKGLAFRRANGKLQFLAPGNAFEKRFRAFVEARAADRIKSVGRNAWRRNAEERIWGGPGECEAWFHNNDHFVMKGLAWQLERDEQGAPRVMGSHRNVAAYRSGRQRVAVKAVPFDSVGDLVRLMQAHQYVHGVQAPALVAQAGDHPELADEVLTSAMSLLSERSNVRARQDRPGREALDTDWSGLFTRDIGPLLHQVTIDYEHKLLLATLDWSEEGMLSDDRAQKRLLEACSLSHRLRMAANLFRNGHQMLEDDVTHTDLKPENILNLPGAAFDALLKAREKGWDRLLNHELESLAAGEPAFEGDFSGIHFGREGAVDNLARGEGLPTSIRYSNWKFTSLGLSTGTQPTVLREEGGELPRIDALLLEQDIANRGTTAWEVVYGSLVDCIPPEEEARRLEGHKLAQERVGKRLAEVIRRKREGKKDDKRLMHDLESAMQQCDAWLLDIVSMRSETIDAKRRITPLFQHPRDNCNGLAVWLDPRVIDMLDHLACDFRRRDITRQQVAKLYQTAETLLRAEATRLERADRRTAANRRHRMVNYMYTRRLHFNPDCGLLGLAELPRQLDEFAELVKRIPDPRRALNEFTATWTNLRLWGASVLDALGELKESGETPTHASDKGREELYALVRSTLLKEHERLAREESRAGETRMQPAFLGLFERRRARLYHEDGKLRFSHTVEP